MSASIYYSRGKEKYDNAPEQRIAADFDAFEAAFLADRSPHKGLAFNCAPLAHGFHYQKPDEYTGVNHWRLSNYVLPRKFLGFDFDGFANQHSYQAMQEYLARYQGFGYTTASHTAEKPRARAILKLSRLVSRDEGITLGRAMQAAMLKDLGEGAIKFDDSVYRGEQPIYTPVMTSETFHFGGNEVDVDAWLAFAAADPATARARRRTSKPAADGLLGHLVHHAPPAETPRAIAVLQNQLAHISADCGYETYRNIVWAILSTGWSCAEDLARHWSLSEPQRYESQCLQNLIVSYDPAIEGSPTLGTVYHHARLGGWDE